MSGLLNSDGERFVDDDVAAGAHRCFRQWCVGFVGARDYDEIDVRMRRRERLRIGDDVDIGQNSDHIPETAGYHRGESVAVRRLEERHVKCLWYETDADHADPN